MSTPIRNYQMLVFEDDTYIYCQIETIKSDNFHFIQERENYKDLYLDAFSAVRDFITISYNEQNNMVRHLVNMTFHNARLRNEFMELQEYRATNFNHHIVALGNPTFEVQPIELVQQETNVGWRLELNTN